jgi:hypothetical protein
LNYKDKGLLILAHDDLPSTFTLRDFHAVAHQLFDCPECVSKGILTATKVAGYVETVRKSAGFRVAQYQEVRT